MGAGVLGLFSEKLRGVERCVHVPLTLTSEDDVDMDTRVISVNPLKGRFPV